MRRGNEGEKGEKDEGMETHVEEEEWADGVV